MKCEECQATIEDYIDGELESRTAREVTAHLSSCAACLRYHEELKREQTIYASYQRDVEVTPALWQSIEARIKQEPAVKSSTLFERLRERFVGAFGVPRFSPAFAAALVLLAVGVTVVVMSLMNSRGTSTQVAVSEGIPLVLAPPPPPPNSNATGTEPQKPGGEKPQLPVTTGAAPQRRSPSNARPTPEQLVREAEQKYVQAIEILSRDVNHKRSQIDPMVLARFDAALSDIDRSIAETRQAVRQNPGDPIALQYLLASYSKKVDALRDMARD
jgi:hypothetical protein